MLATAQEFSFVMDRGLDLIDETDPRTADETIAEWERMLSLPDEQVTEIPATLPERQVAVTQKYASRGGQSQAFFVQLAATCGYTATFSNYQNELSECGVMECGEELIAINASYAMLVTVTAVAPVALPQDDFERVIRHATHSHIVVEFAYP
jgi:uncharacterized protein YmfQ (DUF2313 family)